MFYHLKKDRSVFPLTDDDAIGSLHENSDDQTFDDALFARSTSELATGSYVGNFAITRVKKLGVVLLGIVFGIFILRIGFWQVIHGNDYRQIADNNRTRTLVNVPNRGVITDRYGNVLAWNTPKFHLVVARVDLPEDSILRARRFGEIAAQFQVSSEDFEDRYQKAGDDPTILFADNVPYDVALAYLSSTQTNPNVTVELASTRSYITNIFPSLSHVLGFTGPIDEEDVGTLKLQGYRRFDSIGQSGIEAEYESMLRGTPGVEVIEVNAQGSAIRTLEKTDAVEGQNLTLSLDMELTAAIESIFTAQLEHAIVKRAAAVVTNPKNGEVLALVSYPSFDANLFARGITQDEYKTLLDNPDAPLFNRTIQGEYPSGSTIKPTYAAAALMEGIITPSTTFLSTGGLWLGTRFFPDWRSAGHGLTNVYHAIADSVNTFFYTIGGGTDEFEGLGLEKLMKYAALFGFGSSTGIDLPNEADGFLPTKEWKQETKGEPWYIGDTYNVSIGQGDFLVTPLQMNSSIATFANFGVKTTPHLIRDQAVVSERIVPEETAIVLRDAMRQTVTVGSSTSMNDLPLPVAGKTGTAQWATGKAPHTWFTGFGPFDDPAIAVTVVVEQGANAYYATPIAEDIFRWYFEHRL